MIYCYRGKELVDWVNTDEVPAIGSTIGVAGRSAKWRVTGYLTAELEPADTPTDNVTVEPAEK